MQQCRSAHDTVLLRMLKETYFYTPDFCKLKMPLGLRGRAVRHNHVRAEIFQKMSFFFLLPNYYICVRRCGILVSRTAMNQM